MVGETRGRPNTQSWEEWWGRPGGWLNSQSRVMVELRRTAKHSKPGGVMVETRRAAKYSEPGGVLGGDKEGGQTLRARQSVGGDKEGGQTLRARWIVGISPGGWPNTKSREERWEDQEGGQTLRAGRSGGETRRAAKHSEPAAVVGRPGVRQNAQRRVEWQWRPGGWINTQEDGQTLRSQPNIQEPGGVVGGNQ